MSITTAVIEVPDLSRVAIASLGDDALQKTLRDCAQARRQVDAIMAELSGEIARRSTRELGYAGLAQREGARTPDALVARLTGASSTEARQLVSVGAVLEAPSPWLHGVASAVASGSVSVGAAAGITAGLGSPSASVAADDLLDAAGRLLAEAPALPPEQVARRARELRDELDAAGVADRERLLRDRRFLRLTRQDDGMTRLFGLLDPESAALVADAIDCVTAPRRGGPRFVDAEFRDHAAAVSADARSTEQLALDALVEMVRIAANTDSGTVFGTRKPSVRVHVAAADLARRTGAASLEGQTATVSIATVERLACADGFVPILFQADGSVDVGRAQRLFNSRQRIALGAIWGGCAHPGCDRPPSWCEAHHAAEWRRDSGGTDIGNGVLLCRHHHMLVHNNGWTLRPPGRGSTPWLMHPPPGTAREAVVLVPKHPERLLRARHGSTRAEAVVTAPTGTPHGALR